VTKQHQSGETAASAHALAQAELDPFTERVAREIARRTRRRRVTSWVVGTITLLALSLAAPTLIQTALMLASASRSPTSAVHASKDLGSHP
jgi:hypothetical protein